VGRAGRGKWVRKRETLRTCWLAAYTVNLNLQCLTTPGASDATVYVRILTSYSCWARPNPAVDTILRLERELPSRFPLLQPSTTQARAIRLQGDGRMASAADKKSWESCRRQHRPLLVAEQNDLRGTG